MLKLLKNPLYLAILFLLITVKSILLAQEIPVLPNPIEAMSETDYAIYHEIQKQDELYHQILADYIDTIDLSALNIVYLSALDHNAQMEYINDVALIENFGAKVITSWTDFERFAEVNSPQIVFIHGLAVAEVNTDWTQRAYRSGVFIVGLNMTFNDMQKITGDYCLDEPNPGYMEYFPETALYFTFSLQTPEGANRQLIEQGLLETCKDRDADLGGEYIAGHGVVNLPIVASIDEVVIPELRFDYARYTLPRSKELLQFPTSDKP